MTEHDDDLHARFFVSGHGLRNTLPWKKLNSFDTPLICHCLVNSLSKKHSIAIELLERLSKKLEIELAGRGAFAAVPLNEEIARKKALEYLYRARYATEKFLSELDKPYGGMGRVFHEQHDGIFESSIQDSKELILEAQQVLKALKIRLDHLSEAESQLLASDATDGRNIPDFRASYIYSEIFWTWRRAGKSGSYTTDPHSSKRSGAILAFACDVVQMITDPPTRPTAESVVAHLRKNKFIFDDELHAMATRVIEEHRRSKDNP